MATGQALKTELDAHKESLLSAVNGVLGLLSATSVEFGDWKLMPLTSLRCADHAEPHYYLTCRADAGSYRGWRFPKEVSELRLDFAQGLKELGWTEITGISFEDDHDVLMVTARYLEVVKDMAVKFHPGKVADGISVTVTSPCWSGDLSDLRPLRPSPLDG